MPPFIAALVATLAIGASLSAHSQQESAPATQPDIPIMSLIQAADALDAQAIARQNLTEEQARNLRETRMVLAVNVWQAKDKGSCFAWVGATAVPGERKATRMPRSFYWAMSESREDDQPAAACNRAFRSATQNLAKGDALTLKALQADAAATSDPAKSIFPKIARSPGVVAHRTAGTLNDTGKQLVADTLGPRWHTVLDHRKFAAHLLLMEGKTVEGKTFCLAEYGLVAVPPQGISWKLPGSLGARWKVVQDKNSNENCSRVVVTSALERLRDEYPEMLDDVKPEKGMTYAAPAALRKQVARYDAEKANPRPSAVSSRTRSSTSLRCTNECFNGSCVRTFENGRKERWEAPRVYNPFKQNWEWDISTNACGG